MSKTIEVKSPYNEETIKTITLASASEVDNALLTAKKTFKDKASYLSKKERIEILTKLANIMEQRKEDLTQIALLEGGKPYKDSLVEVERAIEGVKLGINAFHENSGTEIPMELSKSSESRFAFTSREPIGIVVSLSAFNHPLNLVVHQTIPAIVAGCPVIIKPALTTPLSCLNFVELLYEAGLPKQWCQAIVCSNEEAEKLATSKDTAYLSFIGSAKVGWYLRSKVSSGTRCGLEHGGVGPVIVDKSADIQSMIPLITRGAFYHAGQVCVSVQRVFIHEDIFQEVSESLIKRASTLKVGDPKDKDTEVGPLILPREVKRISSWVEEAREAGAKIALGGKELSKTTYAPTIILNPPIDAKVSTQEIFGPVVCLYSFNDADKAIEQANSLPYSFQASIFSKDINKAITYSNKIDAAAVMINDHCAYRVDWMPFGGRKDSGLGVGGIAYSVHEMSEEKLRVIKYTQ